jgi:hypothetical protein
MSDDIILETVGEKAQAIYDAIKAEEKCMIFAPYPIGWIAGVGVDQISVTSSSLEHLEVKRMGITGNLSFQVKRKDD